MSIANELITRGWHQGDFMGEDGSVCLLGAAALSEGLTIERSDTGWCQVDGDLDESPAAKAIAKALEVDYVDEVPATNDDVLKTYDEALRAAKTADEILDAE